MQKSPPAPNPEAYLASLSGWHRRYVEALRSATLSSAPLRESIKWGHLLYHSNGPALLIRAEPTRVLFGFWRGRRLRHIEPKLKPGGKYEMATLELVEETPLEQSTVVKLVQEAVALNVAFGDPTSLSPPKGNRASWPASPRQLVTNFDVRVADSADRLPISRMLELYQHDLSDVWDQDLDCYGEYGYALDKYWNAEGCHPFVVTADGRYAGFALVDQAVRIGTEGYWMDQFFVLRKYRRKGVGDLLARSVFAALPGRWEVGQMPQNRAAQVFWRKVIGQYTGGQFKEHEIRAGWWHGVIQVFDSAAP